MIARERLADRSPFLSVLAALVAALDDAVVPVVRKADSMNRSLGEARYLPVHQYTLMVTFRADAVTAMEIKQAMEDAANALIRPTKDLASAVFTRGAEAVVRAAQTEDHQSTRRAS